MAMVAMAMKFIVGPALIAVASIAVGLKGTVLKVATVQVHRFVSFYQLLC
jgi:auxin efflux carrier family